MPLYRVRDGYTNTEHNLCHIPTYRHDTWARKAVDKAGWEPARGIIHRAEVELSDEVHYQARHAIVEDLQSLRESLPIVLRCMFGPKSNKYALQFKYECVDDAKK